MKSSLVTRNIRIHNRRTSVRLEPQLWRALETIAEIEQTDINALCTKVEGGRGDEGGFTSALRVFIVEYFGGEVISRTTQQPPDRFEITTDEPLSATADAIDPSAEKMMILQRVRRSMAG